MTIALEILGYWLGMALFMWAIMYGALIFARLCEFLVGRLFR
jgi:hypothetical protein